MCNQLKQDARNAELNEDYDLAHSLYSILASRYRRCNDLINAKIYNDKANVYAKDAEHLAMGCKQ
ncbi:hypothetical protein [Pseudoalteromonas phage C7]|uniref:hypothetical protein n=1 Tax=Pseudoalteromonas phage C7 TaxID=2510494 RepID=UPI0010180957|nr:hypothetical protein PP587_gp66 [Pseudoalteromonas phage C7]QAY18020.1 hypothetical protein [Pseudoalteromonas phage C7]